MNQCRVMEMVPYGETGFSGPSDDLLSLDILALFDGDGIQVAVHGEDP